MEKNGLETGVTWRKYDGTYYWDDGGRMPSMSVGLFEGDQSSSTIEVNLTAAIQKWIDDNNAASSSATSTSDSIELMMVASTWGIEESSSKFVNLCSTEATGCDQPSLEITYDWGVMGRLQALAMSHLWMAIQCGIFPATIYQETLCLHCLGMAVYHGVVTC